MLNSSAPCKLRYLYSVINIKETQAQDTTAMVGTLLVYCKRGIRDVDEWWGGGLVAGEEEMRGIAG